MEIIKINSGQNLQKAKLGRAFSKAFFNEPNFTYMIPKDKLRRKALQWFFGSFVIHLGLQYGEVYISDNNSGGAIWIKPNQKVSFYGALRAGLLKMPLYFGFEGVKRSMNLSNYVEQIRAEYAPTPHWYLMALAVDPDVQSKGIGSALIHPILSNANNAKTACYLETFSQKGVNFYKKFGFEVIEEHTVPQGGPRFWSMSQDD